MGASEDEQGDSANGPHSSEVVVVETDPSERYSRVSGASGVS